MSGRVPRSSAAELLSAAALYKEFTGMDPESISSVNVELPKAVLVIGECDGVLYTAVRDGVEESYIHKFRKRSRPLLCVSADGKKLVILGGDYQFTERGIVDT